MTKTCPPEPSELEISLFGPGVGECVVVHLGNNEWMVVDSCLNERKNKSVALQYLEELGINVARQVIVVAVTHWHDDHIRGIGQLFERAESARFVCSAALKTKEFLTLVAGDENVSLLGDTSGVTEFAKVLKLLRYRSDVPWTSAPHHFACEGMCIYRGDAPYGIEVHALSPSSQSVVDAMGEMAQLIPVSEEPIRRFHAISPNKSSVVLLVKTSGLHLLLGADLDRGADDRRGWKAVLKSGVRPKVLSSVFKVAHHGAENGDLPEIWRELLVARPVAVVSPFACGKEPIPGEADIERIKTRTDRLYCTVWPPARKPDRREAAVEKEIDQFARTRREMRKRPGHIRWRAPIAGPEDKARVELFDGAVGL